MRLRGKHALKVLTLEDALGKLSAGKLTEKGFKDLQAKVGQMHGGPTVKGMTPTAPVPHIPLTKVR